MSRIRSLKPEWLDDERLCDCSVEARLLSVALILLADDYGRGRAAPSFLARRAALPQGAAADALAELEGIGYVTLYVVDGQRYYAIRTWARHQRIDNAGRPGVPAPSSSGITGDADIPGPLNHQSAAGQVSADVATQPDTGPPHSGSPRPAAARRDSPLEGMGEDLEWNGEEEEGDGIAREAAPLSETPSVRELWECYLQGWQANAGDAAEPRLTDPRRRLLRDRTETHGPAAVEQALRGVWCSPYHAEKGRTSVEDALKDAPTIEELGQKWVRSQQRRRPRPAKAQPTTEPEAPGARVSQAEALLASLGVQRPGGAA